MQKPTYTGSDIEHSASLIIDSDGTVWKNREGRDTGKLHGPIYYAAPEMAECLREAEDILDQIWGNEKLTPESDKVVGEVLDMIRKVQRKIRVD